MTPNQSTINVSDPNFRLNYTGSSFMLQRKTDVKVANRHLFTYWATIKRGDIDSVQEEIKRLGL